MTSIRTRLLAVFLLIALLPLIVAALITFTTFESALRAQTVINLQAVANTKVRQIESYALERKNDASELAQTPDLPGLVTQFNQALNDDIQSARYVALSSSVRAIFNFYTNEGGYDDVYLLNADGRILYSGLHPEEIGQDYLSGSRRRTQIGLVFDRARTLIETEISDFGYDTNPNQPTAFVAAPIFQSGVIIGVVALQLNNSDLYRVVTDTSGLGVTGETVVGVMEGDKIRLTAPLRLDTRMPNRLVKSTDFPNLTRAVQGIHDAGQGVDYRQVDVVYATRYVPSLRWGLVVKMDSVEAFAAIQTVGTEVAILLLLTLAGVMLLGVFIVRTVTRPILQLNQVVRAFSNGNLRVRAASGSGRDEVGELARGFNELAEQLSTTIGTLEDKVHYRTRALEMQTLTLREAITNAEIANKAKSTFLANMSHELRTPLNAILGFSQLMARDASLDAPIREYLSIVLRSGDHLLSLINDVLEVSRIEAGQTVINPSSFDLYALIKNVEDLFRLRVETKGLRLVWECADDVPQYISSDEGKLRQILINLVGNALKFTSEGGIAIRVAFRPALPVAPDTEPATDQEPTNQGAHLVFEIEDTGDGISDADQKKLFKAFVQTETGIKSGQGSGLGLVITRQFVEMLGGHISLRSQPGQGTVFTFDIAYDPPGEVVTSSEAKVKRVVGIDGPPGTVYRMLVADDKWENRRLMVEWMAAVGFEVREAVNGHEAVAIWQEWDPHLIWMDMRMPIMDGYEATRKIKSTIKGQATVVIALTASAFEHERDIVLSAGCDDFIRKPARESLIFAKIEQHLGLVFKYNDSDAVLESKSTPSAAVTAMAIQAIPANQRDALRQAAEAVDTEAALAVVAMIKVADPAMANHFAELITTYRFDQIQKLLDGTP